MLALEAKAYYDEKEGRDVESECIATRVAHLV